MNLIENIGYEGPYISILITSLSLFDQPKYLASFIIFYFIKYYVVVMMKKIIKQGRPAGFLDKQYNDGGVYRNDAYYGMPSGHSSAVWYSTIFLWLVKQSPYLLIIELALCFNTMYQRWSFRKHTIDQLLVGALVGGSTALIAIIFTKHVFSSVTPMDHEKRINI